VYYAGYHDTAREWPDNGHISPYLRHNRNDFPQNTELSGGDLSDYSRDIGHNSGCNFVRNRTFTYIGFI
jgi:hypothetical protein